MKQLFHTAVLLALAGCATADGDFSSKRWEPIGNRKARVVHWGIVHNHSQGKWDAILKLTNDFEMVGWVDDSSSKAMRMQEPKPKRYEKYPRFTPRQVFEEVKPDLIVVECSNEELVGVSTEIARHGIPMHMDKPLGTDPAGFEHREFLRLRPQRLDARRHRDAFLFLSKPHGRHQEAGGIPATRDRDPVTLDNSNEKLCRHRSPTRNLPPCAPRSANPIG